MSEPPNTTSQQIILHQLPSPQPLSTTTPTAPDTTSLIREYRKGNWNLHETLVLITAKKLDDERRTKASTTPPDPTAKHTPTSRHQHQQQCRTAELRWKWVENYCWKNGCLRSQNQCNDKWDNLLRDYKKVREYEGRGSNELPSYWTMERHQRKERNLPTNLLSQVYEALNEVVHRRYSSKTPTTPLPPPPLQAERPMETPAAPLPHPFPTHQPVATTTTTVTAETSDSSETDQSEKLDSDTKRRKVRRHLGSSIVKSASVLARTLVTCDEKKEKRHRDILELEERRLRLEEAQNEVNRQGMAGLISAVHNLSGAIQALISDRNNGGGAT